MAGTMTKAEEYLKQKEVAARQTILRGTGFDFSNYDLTELLEGYLQHRLSEVTEEVLWEMFNPNDTEFDAAKRDACKKLLTHLKDEHR